MGLLKFFQDFKLGFRMSMEHGTFRQLLEKNRDEACENLAYLVQNETPERLNEIEQWFLAHAIIVTGKPHRLRAMELYAFLKMQETLHYQAFRGFCGEAGPLAA